MTVYLDWEVHPRINGDGKEAFLVKTLASTNDTLALQPEPYWCINRIISKDTITNSVMNDFAFWFAYRMQQDIISSIHRSREITILPYPKETTSDTHGRDVSLTLANGE